ANVNCLSLRKSVDTTSISLFIRYLRDQSLDILALQETHTTSPRLKDLFHKQLQAKDSALTYDSIRERQIIKAKASKLGGYW
ncbi:hypothetical protein CU098_006860, partial [Rhizopus stolonifer]